MRNLGERKLLAVVPLILAAFLVLSVETQAATSGGGGDGDGDGCAICIIIQLFPNESDETKKFLTDLQTRLRAIPDDELRIYSVFDEDICSQIDYCGMAEPKHVARLVAAIVSERQQQHDKELSLAAVNSQYWSNRIAAIALLVSVFFGLFTLAIHYRNQRIN